ncbi:unnamed protein product [Phytophthora fragariaefolia]|uniref:Unnamed protein product n=1 Tax=Phytophthora fragariaefolia TaxID=1490495 RepID=A0A9W7CTS7_9STRA|nr:unnamed protein product [Phytophthora fragariaefolia]
MGAWMKIHQKRGLIQKAADCPTMSHSRRMQLLWVYEKIKDVKKLKKESYAVDQLQAMRWSKEIWQELQGKWAIDNCFRHTGIVFNGVDERCSDSNDTTYDEGVDVEYIIIRASQLSL